MEVKLASMHAWTRDNVTSKGRLVTKGPCRLACSIQLIDWVRSALSVTAMHVCPSRFNPCALALQIRLRNTTHSFHCLQDPTD
jgi:hypothetical protein